MVQRFEPTLLEDNLIGGNQNWGNKAFIPSITNVTGTHETYARVQRLSSLLYFAITFVGNTTTTSSVFTPPITPFMANLGSGNEIVYRGVLFDTGTVFQNDNGSFTLNNSTTTGDVKRISGYYWVK